jgi:hypothetical protein
MFCVLHLNLILPSVADKLLFQHGNLLSGKLVPSTTWEVIEFFILGQRKVLSPRRQREYNTLYLGKI